MAIIRSGILGNLRGKVAGVVGSQWKDKNYLREYVKPANPRSAAQVIQRTKMQDCVAFCKVLVGPVFNAYTDKFQKSMSGFNAFIKANIAIFDGTIDFNLLKITEGKLHSPIDCTAVYTTGTGVCAIAFDDSIGNNGATDDKIYAIVYDKTTELWYFAAAEVDRSAASIDVPCATALTSTDLQAFIWPIKYVATIVNIIGNSVYDVAESA